MPLRSSQKLNRCQYDQFTVQLTDLLEQHSADQSVVSFKNLYRLLVFIESDKEALHTQIAKWCISYLDNEGSPSLTVNQKIECLSISKSTYFRWLKTIDSGSKIQLKGSGNFLERWGRFIVFSKEFGIVDNECVCKILYVMIKENFPEALDITLDSNHIPYVNDILSSKNVILINNELSSSTDNRNFFIENGKFYLYIQVGRCSQFLINLLDRIQEQEVSTRTDYQVVESLEGLIGAMRRYRALDRTEVVEKLANDGSVVRVI